MWSLVTFIVWENSAGIVEFHGMLGKEVTQRHMQNLKDHFSSSLEDSGMRIIYACIIILYTIGFNS